MGTLRRSLALTITLCVSLALATIAQAGPFDPVIVEIPPEGQGPAFVPGVRLVEDLPQEYVEEEFFVAGTATLYTYGHNPPLSPTDIVADQTIATEGDDLVEEAHAVAHAAGGLAR